MSAEAKHRLAYVITASSLVSIFTLAMLAGFMT